MIKSDFSGVFPASFNYNLTRVKFGSYYIIFIVMYFIFSYPCQKWLLRECDIDDYYAWHPGGSLGSAIMQERSVEE